MAEGINWGRANQVGNTDSIASDDAANLVIRENNIEAVRNAIDKAIVGALEAIGQQAEGDAKALTPVDTGRLRNSITHQVDENAKAVYIGTNVEYAADVELNDSVSHRVGQAHYLRDAARNNGAKYAMLIKGKLENG